MGKALPSKRYILFTLAIITTPIAQIWLTWDKELSLSINLMGYSFFYTEIAYLIILFIYIFFTKRLKNNKINNILLLGLFVSFISCLINGRSEWFLRFLIGADFYIFGLLFMVINLNYNHLKIIKPIVLISFYLICAQQILISLGFIQIEANGTEFDQIIRFGTTAGSSIQTAYLLLIIIAILILLYHNKYILFSIHLLGGVSILLSLSRGPIFSLFIVISLFLIVNLKKLKVIIIIIITLSISLVLFFAEQQIGFLSIIEQRVEVEDVTSGRNTRWETTLNVFSNSSFLFGAGNAITPSERGKRSEFNIEKELANSPHNVYLSYLVENGILGFCIFIWLIILLVKSVIKKRTIFSYSLLIFLILPITYMNTEIILRNGLNAFFFWFLFYLLKYEKKTACFHYSKATLNKWIKPVIGKSALASKFPKSNSY